MKNTFSCFGFFVAVYALSVWRQITAKMLSVEKKWHISCMPLCFKLTMLFWCMLPWTFGLEQTSSMSHVSIVQGSLQPCWNIKFCRLDLAWIVYDMIQAGPWFTEFAYSNKYINPIAPNTIHIHRREEGEETTLHNAVDQLVDNCFWSLLHAICGWKGYK